MPVFSYWSITCVLFMQVLGGLSYGMTQAALAGFVMRSVHHSLRGAATGMYQVLFGIGIFIGPVMVGVFMELFSFDIAYWSAFLLLVLAAFLCYIWIPKRFVKMT